MEFDKEKFLEKLKSLEDLAKKKKNVLEYKEINDFFQGHAPGRRTDGQCV